MPPLNTMSTKRDPRGTDPDKAGTQRGWIVAIRDHAFLVGLLGRILKLDLFDPGEKLQLAAFKRSFRHLSFIDWLRADCLSPAQRVLCFQMKYPNFLR